MPTVEQLEASLAENPDDTFLNYGLAMALARSGRVDDALARFDRTLQLDPRYVPAYFQKGQLLANQGEMESAKGVLKRGIEVAGATGDEHACGEMREYLEMLGE